MLSGQIKYTIWTDAIFNIMMTIILILSYIVYSILNIWTLNYIFIKQPNNYMPDSSFTGVVSLSFRFCESGELRRHLKTYLLAISTKFVDIFGPTSNPHIIEAQTNVEIDPD